MLDSEKIGKFIKEIRIKNNLTQKQFADKYNVTYQAVSKWENGINLPDVSLIRKISKDYNISIENLLEGKKSNNNRIYRIILSIIIFAILIVVGFIIFNDNGSFEFKTISTNCDNFKVSGSLAYNENKSSIYISNINYCGGDDNTSYKNIECNLYENNNDVNKKISSCKSEEGNIKLEDYLKDVQLNIDNYQATCKSYNDDSLYLEINATDQNNKTITYKIPLSVNKNCPK